MPRSRVHDGVVFFRIERKAGSGGFGTRDRNGKRCRESTGTEDWQEANRKLRERLHARDGNLLDVIRKGESLGFKNGWILSRELFEATDSRPKDS